MATLLWPLGVLRPRDFAINPAYRNARGGAAIAYGESQIVASDAGMWKATLGAVRIHDSNSRKAFRSMQGLLEGGLTPVLIPLCGADQPFPAGTFPPDHSPIPHDDGSLFDDGSGYAQSIIDVTLAVDAARRATTLTLTKAYAADLEPPNGFSFGERFYRIKTVTAQTDTSATVTIWPPLREAVVAGTQAEFDNPVVRMRLASDQEMDLDLALRRSAEPTLSFVEAL